MSVINTALLLLFIFFLRAASPQSTVETLPGYPGTLPFKLETGYVGVGESNDVQLFYYFIESERDPARDPLLLWITGGPGCSAFLGLVYEIGPVAFDVEEAFKGGLPPLLLNPYAWTKIANIIFLDFPVGTGFSYANTSQGYHSTETKSIQDAYTFLQKWLLSHPKFAKNHLYISGDSYAGKIVPMIVLEIFKGNEAGLRPRMSIEGYVIGNPIMSMPNDFNWRVPYAHRMGLLSDEYYEQAKRYCDGEYMNPNPENLQCSLALQIVNECIENVNLEHFLEPKCRFRGSKLDRLMREQRLLGDDSSGILLPSDQEMPWCRNTIYGLSEVWANDPIVQDALQVRKGTIEGWHTCNESLSFDMDIKSAFHYHQLVNRKRCQALVYSGDHDLGIPFIGTLQWIRDLNLTLVEDWKPWFVNGQTAGYTVNYQYKEGQNSLTFATIKGAGHTAPEYKPKECFAMIDRWFSDYPL